MADIAISPVTPVTNGDIVKSTNPMPVVIMGGAAGVGVATILGSSGAAASVTGSTAETQLASIAVPAMGPTDRLRVTTLWSYTNSGNNKTMRIRLGGAAGTAYWGGVAAANLTSQVMTMISNNGATDAQKGFNATSAGISSPSASALVTGAVETSAGTTIYISGQLASGADTLVLESYTVELLPGV